MPGEGIGDKSREVGELRVGSDEILNACFANRILSRLFLLLAEIYCYQQPVGKDNNIA